MEYRKLGSTGLTVSELCPGTWRFNQRSGGVVETDRDTAHELLDAFAEHGGNFIDITGTQRVPVSSEKSETSRSIAGRSPASNRIPMESDNIIGNQRFPISCRT